MLLVPLDLAGPQPKDLDPRGERIQPRHLQARRRIRQGHRGPVPRAQAVHVAVVGELPLLRVHLLVLEAQGPVPEIAEPRLRPQRDHGLHGRCEVSTQHVGGLSVHAALDDVEGVEAGELGELVQEDALEFVSIVW